MPPDWYLHGIIVAQSVAQSTIDPISGGAAWVGQGILGGVLGWILFVAWPAKDKAAREDRDSRDAAIKQLVERHDAETKELTERFTVALRDMSERNDAANRIQVERFTVTIADITAKFAQSERDQRHDYRDQLNAITLRYESEREFNSNAIRAFLADAHRILEDLRRLLGQPGATMPVPAPSRQPRGSVSDPDAKKGA